MLEHKQKEYAIAARKEIRRLMRLNINLPMKYAVLRNDYAYLFPKSDYFTRGS